MKSTYHITWKGIDIQVYYDPNRWNVIAHLEIRANERLPITETGYKSHFMPRDHFDEHENIEAYVQAWLEHASQSPEWCAYLLPQEQLSLF